MKLEENRERFDELQPKFVGELIESTKYHLEQARVPDDQLYELCSAIVFSSCALLDGSQAFEVEGKRYTPYLAFSESEGAMFYPASTAYLHEYVFRVMDEIFGRDGTP